jgi:small subunit ribosomal protein S2
LKGKKLGIPLVAIVDSNSNPENINFPIPGNDDARRAIDLYCDLIQKTILDAKSKISSDKDEKEDKQSDNKDEISSKLAEQETNGKVIN